MQNYHPKVFLHLLTHAEVHDERFSLPCRGKMVHLGFNVLQSFSTAKIGEGRGLHANPQHESSAAAVLVDFSLMSKSHISNVAIDDAPASDINMRYQSF